MRCARSLAQCALAPTRGAALVCHPVQETDSSVRSLSASGLHIWAADGEVLCQVHDSGHVSDPLAGRRRPIPEVGSGHGLWVVNQLCDLVELRTGSTGTTIRLHVRLGR